MVYLAPRIGIMASSSYIISQTRRHLIKINKWRRNIIDKHRHQITIETKKNIIMERCDIKLAASAHMASSKRGAMRRVLHIVV